MSYTFPLFYNNAIYFFNLDSDENTTIITPTFAVKPEKTSASEGSEVVLECAGHGYPQPKVTWETVESHTFPEGTSNHTTGALIIANMSRDHVGSYICRIIDYQTDLEVVQKQVELDMQGWE